MQWISWTFQNFVFSLDFTDFKNKHFHWISQTFQKISFFIGFHRLLNNMHFHWISYTFQQYAVSMDFIDFSTINSINGFHGLFISLNITYKAFRFKNKQDAFMKHHARSFIPPHWVKVKRRWTKISNGHVWLTDPRSTHQHEYCTLYRSKVIGKIIVCGQSNRP